jgi:hypothetical protein
MQHCAIAHVTERGLFGVILAIADNFLPDGRVPLRDRGEALDPQKDHNVVKITRNAF